MTRETVDSTPGVSGHEREGTGVLARGAVGLEWFASRSFSLGANVGARWRSIEMDLADAPGADGEEDVSLLEVFTSGISVAFHF